MTDAEIMGTVKRIIQRQLDVAEDRIAPEALLVEDLGGNSLSLVELTLALEAEFDIDIPDEDVEGIRTVEDAAHYIEKHANERGAQSRGR